MFASRFDVRGQTVPTGLKNEKGKEEVDVELFFEAITDQHFELHLQDKLPVSGKTAENCRKVNKALPFCGLGLVPIRPGVNDCKWGCLDIDEYNLDHKKLIQDIIKIGPRMIVFRSKSGGAHVFLFTKEWVSAKLMVEKLESIRDALGLPKRTEVFPKQISVEEEGFGSFLNMPYLGGEFSQRYAHDDEGVAINVKDVKKAYDAKAYTAKELQGLELNKLEQKKKTQAFPDGPPCLNHLAKIGFSEGSRNNALFNIGVYCKKAFDEGEWQSKVGEYNRKYFNPPLTYNEEQQNIKSVGGKTYKYKCSDAPIEEHCKAKECAGCKFGVSDGKGQVVLPKISDLKIVMTKPAVYFVSVEGKEIKLTKDEWLNPSKFFDEAYDQAQFNYPHAVPSKPKWKELVVGPLSVDGVVTKIEGIQSLSPKYILEKHLKDFVTDFAQQAKTSYSADLDPKTFMGPQFVAGLDPLQTQAIGIAQAGIGSFAPFLSSVQQAITQAGQDVAGLQQFAGTGAGTGAGSIASFQSPYQQSVIDETLRQFDQSRAGGLQQIGDQAIASGAFGGGRQGALEGQFMADTALGRAGIEAQLRQQGFADAAARRGQAFTQQQALANQRAGLGQAQAGLAQNQFALSNFQQAGRAADVANLGQLGAFRQGLDQSQLAADQQAAQTAAYEPYGRLSQYGNTLTGLAGGVSGQQYAQPAAPSPFATALSSALGVGGLYGKIFG